MQPWVLLRIWHFEVMEQILHHPDAFHFMRTSYLSAPELWRALRPTALAARVEQVLDASYHRRARQLQTEDDPYSLVPFAFFFEWVELADTPANPTAQADRFVYPRGRANPPLVERAIRDLEHALRAPRKGMANRCYDSGFEAFRIDSDNSWHLVSPRDSAGRYASRY